MAYVVVFVFEISLVFRPFLQVMDSSLCLKGFLCYLITVSWHSFMAQV